MGNFENSEYDEYANQQYLKSNMEDHNNDFYDYDYSDANDYERSINEK
jgi:hypothetical protein